MSPRSQRFKARLEQLGCASVALLLETCTGEGCVDPHRRVQKRVTD
jgi:hypothetical protein